MTGDDWAHLGVRAESVEGWQALGVDAFTAALAQGDGYGPSSARHRLAALRAVSAAWRAVGLDDDAALRWHRAGVSAREATEWSKRGGPPRGAIAARYPVAG